MQTVQPEQYNSSLLGPPTAMVRLIIGFKSVIYLLAPHALLYPFEMSNYNLKAFVFV